ncbi:hypothetical protein [Lentilactobacillus kosonis]|uniref:Cell wall surface anchor family protein n=1 Tax=Lentilactobacillus kosonis TaxID=2810561 RepID=A0A401FI86_9LACO|nr:hypothetical protein [Lentilactobacillus kosonis]GAY72008.1 cell wall surface anchor family protein [Lentilactobacillus kosonis]
MENYIKKIILIGSTSAALLLCPVISGGMMGRAFATVDSTTSTEVQKDQHTQTNTNSTSSNSNNVNNQVVPKTNDSSTTITENDSNTTTTYDKPATNNQLEPNNGSNSSTTVGGTNRSDNASSDSNSGTTNQSSEGSGDVYAMIGAGKSGSAATGSSVEQSVKPVIDSLVPSGKLANTKPSVSQITTGSQTSSENGYSAAAQNQYQGQAYTQDSSNADQVAANQYLSQRGLGNVADNSKKSIKSPLNAAFGVSNDRTAAKNKIRLVSANTFYNEFYKKAQDNQQDNGKIVTASGKKAVITTPTKKVNYSVTGQGATTVSESMPLILSTIILGFIVIGFIVFDPLRFIFH